MNARIQARTWLYCGVAALAFAAGPAQAQIRVMVNGERVIFDTVGPMERDGRVLVPLRGVLEKLGAYVDWDAATQTVIATKTGMTVKLPIGSRYAWVNGDRVALDVPASTYAGTTMVPLRFLGETLGADVRWNAGTETVRIVTGERAADFNNRNAGRAHREPIEPDAPAQRVDRRIPEVSSVSTDFTGGILAPGDTLFIRMRATPGGVGYYRIREVVGERKMMEVSPGVYEATWRNNTNRDYRVPLDNILAFVVIGDRATSEQHP